MWQPSVHVTGALIIALTFLNAERVVYALQVLLFVYFVVGCVDVTLARYHLWAFEPTEPHAKRFALVTGATAGIGREMAYLLAEKRYSLVLAARTKEILERMRAEIELVNKPVNVELCVCDLATPQGVQKLITFVNKRELVIDILINNAGAAWASAFVDVPEKQLEEQIELNVLAMTRLTRAIVPQMAKRGIGRVLNIASTAAAVPVPYMALYGASKAFMLSFSQAINFELRSSGVTVTCYCPGPVDTNFNMAAHIEKPLVSYLPGATSHPKDCARLALEAMFNAEDYAHDSALHAFLTMIFRTLVPARLGQLLAAMSTTDVHKIPQLFKR
ncbi:Very-long-chain 3-oxoacyl-coa reductase, partial [Globisporangium splendens]